MAGFDPPYLPRQTKIIGAFGVEPTEIVKTIYRGFGLRFSSSPIQFNLNDPDSLSTINSVTLRRCCHLQATLSTRSTLSRYRVIVSSCALALAFD
jgi:hypothetical protein